MIKIKSLEIWSIKYSPKRPTKKTKTTTTKKTSNSFPNCCHILLLFFRAVLKLRGPKYWFYEKVTLKLEYLQLCQDVTIFNVFRIEMLSSISKFCIFINISAFHFTWLKLAFSEITCLLATKFMFKKSFFCLRVVGAMKRNITKTILKHSKLPKKNEKKEWPDLCTCQYFARFKLIWILHSFIKKWTLTVSCSNSKVTTPNQPSPWYNLRCDLHVND